MVAIVTRVGSNHGREHCKRQLGSYGLVGQGGAEDSALPFMQKSKRSKVPHNLPIAAGRLPGDHHVARAGRVCTHCGGIDVAGEVHEAQFFRHLQLSNNMLLCFLRKLSSDIVGASFAQQDHMQVIKIVRIDFLGVLLDPAFVSPDTLAGKSIVTSLSRNRNAQ